MKTRQAFAKSLRDVRKARKLTQEDFSVVSSRTYISMLERSATSPTLDKVESIAGTMKIHPLSLLFLTYIKAGSYRNVDELIRRVKSELPASSGANQEPGPIKSLREDFLDAIIDGKIGRGLLITRKEFLEYFSRSRHSEKYLGGFLSDSKVNTKHSSSYEKFTIQIDEGTYCIDPFTLFQRMKDRKLVKK